MRWCSAVSMRMRIHAIDASAARHLPGIVQVLTAGDLVGKVKDIHPAHPGWRGVGAGAPGAGAG